MEQVGPGGAGKERGDRGMAGESDRIFRQMAASGTVTVISDGQMPVTSKGLIDFNFGGMPPKYYCDYCDKQFHDTPASRKRHTQGALHQRAKKVWFDSFKDPEDVKQAICSYFVRTGTCQYGQNCRFSHPFPPGSINTGANLSDLNVYGQTAGPTSTAPSVIAFGPSAGMSMSDCSLSIICRDGRRGRTYIHREQVATITATSARRWLPRFAMGGLGLVTLVPPDKILPTVLNARPHRTFFHARKTSGVSCSGGHKSVENSRLRWDVYCKPTSLSKMHNLFSGNLNQMPEGGSFRKRIDVQPQATKRQVWKDEPLVNSKMTKRAMLITKELKKWMQGGSDDGIPLATLERWVAGMDPTRRDWLDVLKEFDYRGCRELLFKLSEWSLNEEWFEPNKRDYAKLIERYGKAGRIEDAERLLEEMEGRGLKVDMVVLTVMLGLYGKARLLERAIKVFDRIKSEGFELDAMVYNTLMSTYGYCGLPWEAEQIFEVMEATGVPATVETFSGLINGYARAEQPEEAQRVFDLMLSRGLKYGKAFTALLDAYGRVGDAEKSRAVFESLRKNGLVPDDRAICLLIAAYEKKNLLSKAVQVVVDLENVGITPGPDSMTGLISWFARVGLLDEAEELFNELVEKKVRITPKMCALMCNAYTKAGRLDRARDFTEDMNNRGIRFTKTSAINFDSAPVPQRA